MHVKNTFFPGVKFAKKRQYDNVYGRLINRSLVALFGCILYAGFTYGVYRRIGNPLSFIIFFVNLPVNDRCRDVYTTINKQIRRRILYIHVYNARCICVHVRIYSYTG